MIRSVLLVCSGNTCRSPMAERLLDQIWRQANVGWDLQVSSAGIGAHPGLAAAEQAITVMGERGLNLSGHRSRGIETSVVDGVDLLLTMTQQHKNHLLVQWPGLQGRVFTLGEYAGTGQEVPDPFGGTPEEYHRCAQSMEQMLQAVVERIRREGAASR